MIPSDHALLSRVVADQAVDPAGWMAARPTHIGASDAAKYAKRTSIEAYVRAKLTPSTFTGNEATAHGHLFEPAIVGFMGIPHNSRMFHHPEFEVFTATPDAIDVLPDGSIVNGEAKVKHRRIDGPSPAEFRQVAFAQYVTGAAYTKWAWLELDENDRPTGDPRVILLDPLDLADVLAPVLDIAHLVADALRAAADILKEAS